MGMPIVVSYDAAKVRLTHYTTKKKPSELSFFNHFYTFSLPDASF